MSGDASAHPALVFLVPSPSLGRVEDVFPERLSQETNDWIGHTREVLKKKRKAVLAGQWRTTTYIGEEHEKIRPITAEHCPAMQEIESVGFLLKWPASAIIRKVGAKGWQIKPSSNFNFLKYSPLTSFAEAGEAEAIQVETGWTVVTPPGWSVLFKNVPNAVFGSPAGLAFAEGIVRSDQATVPLVAHAMIPPGAPEEIKVKRGEPMAAILAFRRQPVELAVVTDPALVEETAKLGESIGASFQPAGGVYRKLFVDGDNPTPLYPKLLAAWKAEHASKK